MNAEEMVEMLKNYPVLAEMIKNGTIFDAAVMFNKDKEKSELSVEEHDELLAKAKELSYKIEDLRKEREHLLHVKSYAIRNEQMLYDEKYNRRYQNTIKRLEVVEGMLKEYDNIPDSIKLENERNNYNEEKARLEAEAAKIAKEKQEKFTEMFQVVEDYVNKECSDAAMLEDYKSVNKYRRSNNELDSKFDLYNEYIDAKEKLRANMAVQAAYEMDYLKEQLELIDHIKSLKHEIESDKKVEADETKDDLKKQCYQLGFEDGLKDANGEEISAATMISQVMALLSKNNETLTPEYMKEYDNGFNDGKVAHKEDETEKVESNESNEANEANEATLDTEDEVEAEAETKNDLMKQCYQLGFEDGLNDANGEKISKTIIFNRIMDLFNKNNATLTPEYMEEYKNGFKNGKASYNKKETILDDEDKDNINYILYSQYEENLNEKVEATKDTETEESNDSNKLNEEDTAHEESVSTNDNNGGDVTEEDFDNAINDYTEQFEKEPRKPVRSIVQKVFNSRIWQSIKSAGKRFIASIEEALDPVAEEDEEDENIDTVDAEVVETGNQRINR